MMTEETTTEPICHYMLSAWTSEDIRNETNPSLSEKQDFADYFRIQDRAIRLVTEDGGYEESQVELVYRDKEGKIRVDRLGSWNARDYVYVLKYRGEGGGAGFNVLAADMIENEHFDSYEDLIIVELDECMEDTIERCNELMDLAYETRGNFGPYDCTGRWFTRVWSHKTEKLGDRLYGVYLCHAQDV